jgi:hypothetical protein
MLMLSVDAQRQWKALWPLPAAARACGFDGTIQIF